MIDESRLKEIEECCAAATPGPWEWRYSQTEEPIDQPELLAMGIKTLPGYRNIQLVANGKHRFWVVLTDTGVADCVRDFDLIKNARTYVEELVLEVRRLKRLLDASQ
jgi:hypothetical protein